jgi:hypothetical protein
MPSPSFHKVVEVIANDEKHVGLAGMITRIAAACIPSGEETQQTGYTSY